MKSVQTVRFFYEILQILTKNNAILPVIFSSIRLIVACRTLTNPELRYPTPSCAPQPRTALPSPELRYPTPSCATQPRTSTM
jgi:hypothetical protein